MSNDIEFSMERNNHIATGPGAQAGLPSYAIDPLSDVIGSIINSDPAASSIFNNDPHHTHHILPTHSEFGQYHTNQHVESVTMRSIPQQRSPQPTSSMPRLRDLVRVQIVEQPAPTSLRFRYLCEGRLAGSIPGASSTPDLKTYPTIQLVGDCGGRRAMVVVSCVTADSPHRPHPHNLVGKECCTNGICQMEIPLDDPRRLVSFANLGIQCVRKKDIAESLNSRRKYKIDPFNTGFKPENINLNAVRLCFQVFLENVADPKRPFNIALKPVVSNEIHDRKANTDLVICRLSHASGSVLGGLEMILLCEKISRDDIAVRFFETQNNEVVWEAFGEFQQSQVHKQFAICFRTPAYRNIHVDQCVNCFIQLRRTKTGAFSDPVPFEYYPISLDPSVGRKRKKPDIDPGLMNQLMAYDTRFPTTHRIVVPQAIPAPHLSSIKNETGLDQWRTPYNDPRESPSPNRTPFTQFTQMSASSAFPGTTSSAQQYSHLVHPSAFPDFDQHPFLMPTAQNTVPPNQRHIQSPQNNAQPVGSLSMNITTAEPSRAADQDPDLSDLLRDIDEMEGLSGELSGIMRELDKDVQ